METATPMETASCGMTEVDGTERVRRGRCGGAREESAMRLWRWTVRLVSRFGARGDRGDVPGWVMVTVMTAGLVVVIFAVFSDRITAAVENALDTVISETDGR
jgi:hypothetical protein